MTRERGFCTGCCLAALLLLVLAGSAWADPHPNQSVNVAIVDSPAVTNGGVFPTGPAAPFDVFTFTSVPVANVNAATLAAYDTVLLNVASPGMNCTTASLTAAQKADLVAFVDAGGKLIIYDSECSTADYSWLPYPFTTDNPGQIGSHSGVLGIVEENVLSSSNGLDPHFIDAAALTSATDAVGDMNVMLTLDENWCLDMAGTNYTPATGPVHAYARYGQGLITYNGLDVDYIHLAGDPVDGLKKIWLQELQAPFNPSPYELLPCGIPVIGITLVPETDTNGVNEEHTVTATITDLFAEPQPGVEVTFAVVSGPNAGASGVCSANADCTTDANGQVSFTYVGSGGEGTDIITACFMNLQGQELCAEVTKNWIVNFERAHLGCNFTDLGIHFTANQPAYWSMGTGTPRGFTPFAEALDPGDPPGRPDPDGSDDRVMRGYVIAFAIDEATGHSIRWNHLKGDALIVNWGDGSAWEYNANAFAAMDTVGHDEETGDNTNPEDLDGNGVPDDQETLRLDGSEYDNCPSQLVLDFYAVGATCLGQSMPIRLPVVPTVEVDTDLTLLPMILDVRQDHGDDILTKARFTIWDMNENMLTSQTRCIECWDQALLSNYDYPNHFELIATDKGKAVIEGEASTECPGSVDAPLLGLAATMLNFANGAMHGMAGMNLVGKGVEEGSIKFDLADDILEKRGGARGSGDLREVAEFLPRALESPERDAALLNTVNTASSDPIFRTTAEKKGSLLIFPKVELRWSHNANFGGWIMQQDTFIDLTNDYPGAVYVKLYYVNGDPALAEQQP